jgi:hypothetical protein
LDTSESRSRAGLVEANKFGGWTLNDVSLIRNVNGSSSINSTGEFRERRDPSER